MLRRHPPERAAERVVAGIERRAARTVFPRWWAGWSALRGIANPLFDSFLERDGRVREAVRRGSEP